MNSRPASQLGSSSSSSGISNSSSIVIGVGSSSSVDSVSGVGVGATPSAASDPDSFDASERSADEGLASKWRIKIEAVQGGGSQVQLTEAAFVLGVEQLGAGLIAPVISPGGTNGQGTLRMNNANPVSGYSCTIACLAS